MAITTSFVRMPETAHIARHGLVTGAPSPHTRRDPDRGYLRAMTTLTERPDSGHPSEYRPDT